MTKKEKKALYDKEYRKKNKEKIDLRVKKWKEENPEQRRIYYKKNKDHINKKSKAWHKSNKERVRHLNLVRDFGITLDEYNKLLTKQNECCAICKIHQNELNIALAVDHDHKTGKIRGLLCTSCNNGLGRFKDNKDLLSEAIKYLRN